MYIAETLIDISHESQLNQAEKKSLRLIAEEIKKLQTMNKALKKQFETFKDAGRLPPRKLSNEPNKIRAALSDPKAPWYGSALVSEVADLLEENAKLNIILYHRENGLAHPDLRGEIDKSKLAEENKQLKEQNRWIPVSERLPENIRDVWIVLRAKATDSYVAGIGFYGEDETGYGWEIYGNGLLTEVAHWKPIVLPVPK